MYARPESSEVPGHPSMVEPHLGLEGEIARREELERALRRALEDRKRLEQALRAQEEALRASERQLQEARRAAEVASRAKDEFLAMLGHELRNPLAPILTALELMRLRLGDDVASNERSIIERQVRHLVVLVDDLLDISRITRGRMALDVREVEVADFVARGIDLASPLIEERRHRLTTTVPTSGLRVVGDERRLAQIVANLLTNAAKYTEPQGMIQVSASARDSEVVLNVRDNGIGIGGDLLPRLFDVFVQGERSIDRSQGGLGLGLAIVHSLVTMHGGRVTAHSEGLGHGSEFTVRLPLVS